MQSSLTQRKVSQFLGCLGRVSLFWHCRRNIDFNYLAFVPVWMMGRNDHGPESWVEDSNRSSGRAVQTVKGHAISPDGSPALGSLRARLAVSPATVAMARRERWAHRHRLGKRPHSRLSLSRPPLTTATSTLLRIRQRRESTISISAQVGKRVSASFFSFATNHLMERDILKKATAFFARELV